MCKYNILAKDFYLQKTETVAKELLGKILWKNTEFGLVSGIIVETEAYLPNNDEACHASFGKTKRNEKMFEEGGISYVYLIYGMYYCFNTVTGKAGSGEAVLIRALEPLENIETMKKHRTVSKDKDLTNGPSKLCLAMNIDKNDNGLDITKSKDLYLTEGLKIESDKIITTTRIGITKAVDLPLRFYLKDNKYVSKKVTI